jgi:hypothetical protein
MKQAEYNKITTFPRRYQPKKKLNENENKKLNNLKDEIQ